MEAELYHNLLAYMRPETGSPLVKFETRLRDLLHQFKNYEQGSTQAAVANHVPLDYLSELARSRYESSEFFCGPHTPPGPELRDILLLELMDWFKTAFFSWMDSPPCPSCGAATTTPLAGGMPTPEEKAKSAGRVETFTCIVCFPPTAPGPRGPEVARFPRYNDPKVLLETRRGRCGEWANCFALILRAAKFEVRHVTDWTDHVWVEVFSEAKDRWVHCDPCENSWDTPLMYEEGWGKKLTYVIAVSQDDIQDVTWRYTKDHPGVLARRTLVPELWLVKTILALRAQTQDEAHVVYQRRVLVLDRMFKELASFIKVPGVKSPEVKESEKVGRRSGALAWRLGRSEVGLDHVVVTEYWDWEMCPEYENSRQCKLSYDCALDKYEASGFQVPEKWGWESGVASSRNVERKEERDWKMVYLARQPQGNGEAGRISWKFVIPPPENADKPLKKVKSVQISLKGATFHSSASLALELSTCENRTFPLSTSPVQDMDGNWEWSWDQVHVDLSAFACDFFILSLRMEGGSGAQGWQHAQLFRQQIGPGSAHSSTLAPPTPTETGTSPQFLITINLME